MASWRGDLDAVDRLEAEVEGLIGQVDDPQVEATFKTVALEAAIARGSLDEAFLLASEILERVDLGRSSGHRRGLLVHRRIAGGCLTIRDV